MSATPYRETLSERYARAYASSRPARRRVSPQRMLRISGFAVLGFVATIAAAVTIPTIFGLQSFTVLSGSMEPTIGTGDVIVVRKIEPLDARIGDVVTFRSPDDASKMITHRVTKVQASNGLVRFTTRGDANTGSERWAVASNGVIGLVAYRVPKLGYVTSRLSGTLARLGLIVVPALLLAVLELRRIWRTEPTEP